jgi:hypothetical protein
MTGITEQGRTNGRNSGKGGKAAKQGENGVTTGTIAATMTEIVIIGTMMTEVTGDSD